MPPPSLSMTTIRTGVVDLAQGGEAAEVVEQAEVAGDDRRRPPGRGRGADPGGDQAVEAVGAAVAEEEGVGADRAEERLLVADRHARGRVDEVAVGVGVAERRVQARLGQRVEAVELGVDRLAAPRPRPRSRPPAARGRSPSRAAHPAASSVGSARRIAAARRVGSFQPPRGSTTIWSAPEAASQARSGLLVGISPKRRTRSGTTRVRELLVAQQQVVGGDDVRAVVGPAADLRGRLGEDREAGDAGEVGERLAQLRVELAAGDDHARERLVDVLRDLLEQELGRLEVDRGHRGQRSAGRGPAAPARRSPSPPPRPAIGASGSRQGRLRWTGPGRGSPRAAAKARQAVER